mmetsp:Transcript_5358/g.8138  ORF Transcript_5358/g.8138 Transcript_5358/m.8138 type:complete len:82 (+) Transcript_5358:718-963(+)
MLTLMKSHRKVELMLKINATKAITEARADVYPYGYEKALCGMNELLASRSLCSDIMEAGVLVQLEQDLRTRNVCVGSSGRF